MGYDDDSDNSSSMMLLRRVSWGEEPSVLSLDKAMSFSQHSTSSDDTADSLKHEGRCLRTSSRAEPTSRLVPLLIAVASSVALAVGIFFFLHNDVKPNQRKHENFQGTVSRAELAQHNTPEDCWLAIHGVVYDLTGYAPDHPGGARLITDLAGTDATAEYDLEHPQSLMRTIPETVIGDLVDNDGRGEGQPSSGFIGDSEDENYGEYLEGSEEGPGNPTGEGATDGGVPPSEEKKTVFISEMHYRNVGSDANQFIEVVFSNQMDVSGYQVLFARSSGEIYLVESLRSFEIGESVGGLTFAYRNVPTFHNGPDGVALIDANLDIVEFISYGGTIDGLEGALEGEVATDIGVEQPNDSPVDFSIQKGGPGCLSDEFVWQDASLATPGKLNTNMEVACYESGVAVPAPAPWLGTSEPTATCLGPHFSLNTISSHGNDDDCWQAIFGLVYDFTSWAEDHSGGSDEIFPHCGTDSTAAYLDRHPNSILMRQVEDFMLGHLGEEDGEFPIPCERRRLDELDEDVGLR